MSYWQCKVNSLTSSVHNHSEHSTVVALMSHIHVFGILECIRFGTDEGNESISCRMLRVHRTPTEPTHFDPESNSSKSTINDCTNREILTLHFAT